MLLGSGDRSHRGLLGLGGNEKLQRIVNKNYVRVRGDSFTFKISSSLK